MLAQMSIDGAENGLLVVFLGFVSEDPRTAKLFKNRGNVLVFELHGPMSTANSCH